MKHSGVQRFEVDLRGLTGAILLMTRDAGAGFNVEEVANSQPGLGVVSMREPINLITATIAINSKPKAGTEINVRIPIATDRATNEITPGNGG